MNTAAAIPERGRLTLAWLAGWLAVFVPLSVRAFRHA